MVQNANQSFRDEKGCVLRQAARFKIHAFDEEDNVITELTSEKADIKWRVELANKKAAWRRFEGSSKVF